VGKPKFALYIDIEHRWLNVKSPFFKRASAKVSRFLNIRNTSALKNKKFSQKTPSPLVIVNFAPQSKKASIWFFWILRSRWRCSMSNWINSRR
jgi:hypothetical protein